MIGPLLNDLFAFFPYNIRSKCFYIQSSYLHLNGNYKIIKAANHQSETRTRIKGQSMLYQTLHRKLKSNTNPIEAGLELWCPWEIWSSCSTSYTVRVILVTKPVISHDKDRTTLCLRETELIRGHLQHRCSVTLSYAMVVIVKLFSRRIDWLVDFLCFNATFSYIMATSFSGGGSRSTRREPPTIGKQLVNFITCSCESSAPFL